MSVGEALSRSRSLPLPPPPSPPPLLSSSSSKQQEQRQQQQHQRASQHSSASSSHQHEHQQRDEEETKQRQCFPYSRTHSVAAASFRFPLVDELTGSPTGRSAQAQRGELVPLRCDSVVCPPPAVRDCYMREGICDEAKEFCMLEDHVKFGPAAAGAGGATPLVAYLDCSFFAKESDKYPWIWEQVCANRSDWGPWTTTRGRVRALRCGGGGGEEASREREREREGGKEACFLSASAAADRGVFPLHLFFEQLPLTLSLFLQNPNATKTVCLLPQGAAELLGLDLEAEVGVEVVVLAVVAPASPVCREHEGRPPAAPPPALRPRAPLHGRRAADAEHVRQGEAQRHLLPGALVVSLRERL